MLQFNDVVHHRYDDLLILFQALHVITNNRPDSVGGGGSPLTTLAPPFCKLERPTTDESVDMGGIVISGSAGSAQLPSICTN